MQLIKFWPSRAPGKGVCGGAKFFGSALLQPAHSGCVSSERFFIFIIIVKDTKYKEKHTFDKQLQLMQEGSLLQTNRASASVSQNFWSGERKVVAPVKILLLPV